MFLCVTPSSEGSSSLANPGPPVASHSSSHGSPRWHSLYRRGTDRHPLLGHRRCQRRCHHRRHQPFGGVAAAAAVANANAVHPTYRYPLVQTAGDRPCDHWTTWTIDPGAVVPYRRPHDGDRVHVEGPVCPRTWDGGTPTPRTRQRVRGGIVHYAWGYDHVRLDARTGTVTVAKAYLPSVYHDRRPGDCTAPLSTEE